MNCARSVLLPCAFQTCLACRESRQVRNLSRSGPPMPCNRKRATRQRTQGSLPSLERHGARNRTFIRLQEIRPSYPRLNPLPCRKATIRVSSMLKTGSAKPYAYPATQIYRSRLSVQGLNLHACMRETRPASRGRAWPDCGTNTPSKC